jgi:transposase
MATDGLTFDQWLRNAKIAPRTLSPEQAAKLESVFHFLQDRGWDYYSKRVASHFLLHCRSELKVAQIARLLGVSRPTASRQQGLSSKEVIQRAHHRMAGKPYGKLLPRYAGPIAQFLMTHPQATRLDILDFIEKTWDVRVSRIALYHFLKKYGLDEASRSLASSEGTAAQVSSPDLLPVPVSGGGLPAPLPVPQAEFFLPRRSTRGRSSSCRPR